MRQLRRHIRYSQYALEFTLLELPATDSEVELKESSTIQQENLMKTALLEYTITNEDPKPIPALVINLARKMEW